MVDQDLCAATCGRCIPQEACDDVPPPFGGCDTLVDMGNCNSSLVLLAGWCKQTCGRCSALNPNDAAPRLNAAAGSDDNLLLEMGAGKNGSKATKATANAAMAAASSEVLCMARSCEDLPPPGALSCADHVARGECSQAWMLANRYCAASCGRCVS